MSKEMDIEQTITISKGKFELTLGYSGALKLCSELETFIKQENQRLGIPVSRCCKQEQQCIHEKMDEIRNRKEEA